MTKEIFIHIHHNRGFQVEDLGKIVIISLEDYRAVWFFNPDGSIDKNHPPIWHIDRP